jgi:outer membrane beta-barrel protein
LKTNAFSKLLKGFTATLLAVTIPAGSLIADDEFDDYEVRVIRPKFFQKAERFELGAQFNAVMNQTFIYTYMVSGLMTYHFNEAFGIEASGAYGFSVDKSDKETLFDQFDIRTQIIRTEYAMEAALQWTPIYGKWQLPSGQLIYFDTFLALGGGLTGVYWDYKDFCVRVSKDGSSQNLTEVPASKTATYPDVLVGLGQRYFVSKDVSVKWDIRHHTVFYDVADASCDPAGGVSGGESHYNVTLQVGASKFF